MNPENRKKIRRIVAREALILSLFLAVGVGGLYLFGGAPIFISNSAVDNFMLLLIILFCLGYPIYVIVKILCYIVSKSRQKCLSENDKVADTPLKSLWCELRSYRLRDLVIIFFICVAIDIYGLFIITKYHFLSFRDLITFHAEEWRYLCYMLFSSNSFPDKRLFVYHVIVFLIPNILIFSVFLIICIKLSKVLFVKSRH